MDRDVILRKVGGSFIITVPADVVRAYGLEPWRSLSARQSQGDETALQFFKVVTNKVPAAREMEAAE